MSQPKSISDQIREALETDPPTTEVRIDPLSPIQVFLETISRLEAHMTYSEQQTVEFALAEIIELFNRGKHEAN